MDDTTLNDLKQFIVSTVTQHTSEIREDIKSLDNKLSKKIDDISESVAEAIGNVDEVTDAQLKDHETRITRLEHKAA